MSSVPPILRPRLTRPTGRGADKWRPYAAATDISANDGALVVHGQHEIELRYKISGNDVAASDAVAALVFSQLVIGQRLHVTTLQLRDVFGNVLVDIPESGRSDGRHCVWDRREVANFAQAAGLEFAEEYSESPRKAKEKNPPAVGHVALPGPPLRNTYILMATLLLIGIAGAVVAALLQK